MRRILAGLTLTMAAALAWSAARLACGNTDPRAARPGHLFDDGALRSNLARYAGLTCGGAGENRGPTRDAGEGVEWSKSDAQGLEAVCSL